MERKETEEPTFLDGLTLLLENKKCNLGWRVVAKALLSNEDFEGLLRKTWESDAKPLSELIDAVQKKEVSRIVKVLRLVRDEEHAEDESELAALLKRLDINAFSMATAYLKEEIKPSVSPESNPGIRKIPVTATTIQSSKGLAAEYVFLTHFDDQYFIRDSDKSKISDQDVCSFLVALTRARRKVFLFSSDTKKTPVFLDWIDATRIQRIETRA